MNRLKLKALLDAEGVRTDAYSIDGLERDESLCLKVAAGGWVVFYSERGLRSGEKLFETEDDACNFLAMHLLADPGNVTNGREGEAHSTPELP